MQVSAASDYRLQDQALGEVLAMPGVRNTDAQRQQGQQGVMLVGPGSHDALAAMWADTVGSLQTEVCPESCGRYHKDITPSTTTGTSRVLPSHLLVSERACLVAFTTDMKLQTPPCVHACSCALPSAA